ncbi:dynein light chain LC8-type [Schistosoma japonicum]|uniref:Dynein light chain n=1 Tax=Schistosoma japonicum TaxID=6182 RepID=C1L4J7_SCHJA|nr:dynein light chain LC8-type [Schistosoma japonicum]CAX69625.1 hypothetical protein [Schistosoma japonicum]
MKRFRIHEKSIQIKKVLMDDQMQMNVISTVVAALHLYGNENTRMKKFIESRLNQRYHPKWHYISGYEVDSCLLLPVQYFISFNCEDKSITVFKTI